MPKADQINQLVDHLFRHDAGRLVAVLTRIFGAETVDGQASAETWGSMDSQRAS